MNSRLILGVSPRTPLIFFYLTMTRQSSCIFCLFAFTFTNYFGLLHSLSKKTLWLQLIPVDIVLLRGIGRKKASLRYVRMPFCGNRPDNWDEEQKENEFTSYPGVSPRTPLNFFYSTVTTTTCQSSCTIFLSLHSLLIPEIKV